VDRSLTAMAIVGIKDPVRCVLLPGLCTAAPLEYPGVYSEEGYSGEGTPGKGRGISGLLWGRGVLQGRVEGFHGFTGVSEVP